MQLYKALHDNHGPKTHDEFMKDIIKEGGIQLPALRPGDHYIYDPVREELMVEKHKVDTPHHSAAGRRAAQAIAKESKTSKHLALPSNERATMRQHLVWIAALAALAPAARRRKRPSWIFSRTAYTHSPVTGQRIAQYCPEQPSYLRYDDTYQQSGYRHNLITIGSGDNVDHMNIVETWGLGLAIRPYGEWECPYRPYATPYTWTGYGGYPNPGMAPYNAWQNPYAAGQGVTGPNYRPYPQFYGPPGGQPSGQFNGPGGQGPTPSPAARRSVRRRRPRRRIAAAGAESSPWAIGQWP